MPLQPPYDPRTGPQGLPQGVDPVSRTPAAGRGSQFTFNLRVNGQPVQFSVPPGPGSVQVANTFGLVGLRIRPPIQVTQPPFDGGLPVADC